MHEIHIRVDIEHDETTGKTNIRCENKGKAYLFPMAVAALFEEAGPDQITRLALLKKTVDCMIHMENTDVTKVDLGAIKRANGGGLILWQPRNS